MFIKHVNVSVIAFLIFFHTIAQEPETIAQFFNRMSLGTTPSTNWFDRLNNTSRYSAFWTKESGSIIQGLWQVFSLPEQKVTIIGSARLKAPNQYYLQAQKLANTLAKNHIGVISGGGTGIMQAAAEGVGAYSGDKQLNLGISVEGLKNEQETKNQKFVSVDNFEIRQWLMFNFSCAVVAFPGGVGTLYELLQIITLIDTHHMASIPVFLFGSAHWTPLIKWLNHLANDKHLITPQSLTILIVTDSVEDITKHIQRTCLTHVKNHVFNLLV